ncbi:MAG TPA: ORC1-type DNA replication protein [Thermoplasmatales archaeon]|nr:ORC1-type DNA replication protein [Thermoplasmatales archaeon]
MTPDVFGSLMEKNSLFINRDVLRPTYMPEVLPHREKEITNLAEVFLPALRGESPSNVFIYGKTGTGKTAVAKYVGNQLVKKGEEMNKKVHFTYINCEVVDTHYRLLQNIANHFIDTWADRIPFTGWPTDEVYARLTKVIDDVGGVVIVVLDEIDKLKGDEALYTLSRIDGDLKNSKVSLVGISNDLKFTEFLDPRVKSSLGEENMVFYPYDARELQDILEHRAQLALKPDALSPSVIPLCAAIAAQEHGDARRALDLLRISAELAEREHAGKITEKHIRKALHKIELDHISEVIRTLPLQSKILLLATIKEEREKKNAGLKTALTTGEVYDTYKMLCKKVKLESLTQRRVADLISELDMLGIITARVISKGRYGRTREIQTSTSTSEMLKVLQEDETVKPLLHFRGAEQTRLM